ncbi:hypothetical protein B4U79_19081 [Dinothrombium tinctorium]|uniref:Peptidase S1 domain-containing protein n=1 Tax=Dinothrombium tinctorium TaxID=1965070 RepID=A0A443QRS1_9ACAR|nr:hypothetical protein B4U79_19081 [Dinothrombium tinctorium]
MGFIGTLGTAIVKLQVPVLREAVVVGLNSNSFSRNGCIGGSISALGLTGLTSSSDSGDPLMLQRNGIWTLVGVSRNFCGYDASQNCDPSCPLLVTRVSNYLDWINGIIINHSVDYSDILDTFNHFQGERR